MMRPYIYLSCSQDRQKTLKQIDEFFNKKVAPKELIDEIKVPGYNIEQLLLNIGILYFHIDDRSMFTSSYLRGGSFHRFITPRLH
jgi:hypothetical protein